MTRRIHCLVALLSLASSMPADAGEPGADFTRAMAGLGPTIQQCQTDPNCAANPSLCASYPFAPTSCWPTSSGPAKADVIVGANPVTSTNMLLCSAGGYSLCFFSGPPQPLTAPKNLTPLPCRVGPDGVANCTCRYFTDSFYVDVNAILNQGVYYQTVDQCGPTGSGCRNIAVCNSDGSSKPGKTCPTLEAPVCSYVRNQTASNPTGSLIPGADAISAFGFDMNDQYQLASVDCPVAPGQANRYAGCMTAPCYFPNGQKPADGGLIQCLCPIAEGDYQVGQPIQPSQCTLPPDPNGVYIWSAARTVKTTTSKK